MKKFIILSALLLISSISMAQTISRDTIKGFVFFINKEAKSKEDYQINILWRECIRIDSVYWKKIVSKNKRATYIQKVYTLKLLTIAGEELDINRNYQFYPEWYYQSIKRD